MIYTGHIIGLNSINVTLQLDHRYITIELPTTLFVKPTVGEKYRLSLEIVEENDGNV